MFLGKISSPPSPEISPYFSVCKPAKDKKGSIKLSAYEIFFYADWTIKLVTYERSYLYDCRERRSRHSGIL